MSLCGNISHGRPETLITFRINLKRNNMYVFQEGGVNHSIQKPHIK